MVSFLIWLVGVRATTAFALPLKKSSLQKIRKIHAWWCRTRLKRCKSTTSICVHLADLSGVLEIVAIGTLAYSFKQLQRRELGLAQFTHALTMGVIIIIGGHFLEEHVLGVSKLEALLKDGFQALCTSQTFAARSLFFFPVASQSLPI